MTTSAPLAADHPLTSRLGPQHGYRLLGDDVELHAELLAVDPSAGHWCLQLWADDTQCIAELHLDNLHPDGDGHCQVIGLTRIAPPAGQGTHILSLRLLCRRGATDDGVVDSATYPLPVQFVQPALLGEISAGWLAGQLTVQIERLSNLRSPDNLSGTLALEIIENSAGGDTTLAQIALGALNGQCDWPEQQFAFTLTDAPAGPLKLQLSEWTATGYIPRDQRLLPLPTASRPTTAVAPTPPIAPAPAPATGISVNQASIAELSALKGVGPTLATAIVAGRPYARLDDLTRVKGMGAKLLARLRQALSL